jgi:hypothetical protein
MERQGLGNRGWGSGIKGAGFGIGGWGFGTLLGLAILLIRSASAFAAAPATDSPARLTVNVRNYAQLDRKTLVRAGEVAHRILQRAGIEATFIPLAPDEKYQEGSTPGSLNFSIKVLSREMAKKLRLPTTNMGLAPGEEHERTEAFVFARVAADLAQKQTYASLAEILGHAMAHEIGHLFNLRHSPQGIMHGDWDERDLSNMAVGRLNFSPEQAGQIRAEMTRRTQPSQTVEMASL